MKKLAIAAFLASFVPAHAQTNCADTKDVHDILSGNYGEELHSLGLSDRGAIIEVWTNYESRSYTVIATGPNGVSCILDQGQSFQVKEKAGKL